ncbi:MAG: DUF1566 domain-containing protein [Leptospiraceae bacterium]|nr:DUF1566 domain-containing protein [Leptospiraceae bacterium]MCK6381022.1 DUF1566 domain-containing protein [Leptospiraceae bacterium]
MKLEQMKFLREYLKKASNLFLFFGIFFYLFNCQDQKLNSPCDPESEAYRNTNIIKHILMDDSPFCGLIPYLGIVATPRFNPSSGNKTTLSNIEISTTTPGATIHFSTDGTNPTSNSTIYSSALENIWSLAGKTIKAIAVRSGMTSSEVLTGIFSYLPLKTGQQISYAVGDDGESQTGVSRSYTDNGDGTVKDNATGLIWQKCSVGQTGSDCSGGTINSNDWDTAISTCSGLSLAGKTWRLPTRQELETLPDYSKDNPSIEVSYFPNTAAGYYWSSSVHAVNTSQAWNIQFTGGAVSGTAKTTTYSVRCVSGPTKNYTSNFTDNGDGTIKDNATGLVWQKCSIGQSGLDCSGVGIKKTWTDAISTCTGLSLAGKFWRLPNVNEFKTIVDTNKSTSPVIDVSYFPNTASSDDYWSSTTSTVTANAWLVNFDDGSSIPFSKSSNLYVRCVSGP